MPKVVLKLKNWFQPASTRSLVAIHNSYGILKDIFWDILKKIVQNYPKLLYVQKKQGWFVNYPKRNGLV